MSHLYSNCERYYQGRYASNSLESELGAPPVSPLGVVADGVASPHPETLTVSLYSRSRLNLNIPDPLRDGAVLLLLLGELALDAEGLESGHDLL